MHKGSFCRITFISEVQGKSPAFSKIYFYQDIASWSLSVCKGRGYKVRNNKTYISRKVRKQYLKKEMYNFGCLFVCFPALQPTVVVFSQHGSGL
jgi:hypothetical protein